VRNCALILVILYKDSHLCMHLLSSAPTGYKALADALCTDGGGATEPDLDIGHLLLTQRNLNLPRTTPCRLHGAAARAVHRRRRHSAPPGHWTPAADAKRQRGRPHPLWHHGAALRRHLRRRAQRQTAAQVPEIRFSILSSFWHHGAALCRHVRRRAQRQAAAQVMGSELRGLLRM